MPKIKLKYKSPEFADDHYQHRSDTICCEMPGCTASAEHKAPKHRALNEYYNFCFEHVREYNKAWDFFSGMSQTEVQDHILNSHYGDRPTWKYGGPDNPEDELFRAAQKEYRAEEKNTREETKKKDHFPPQQDSSTPEHEALAIMGLSTPITMDEIKTRYKTLAKKHHPDLNKNSPEREELLKRINMAYTILKLAFDEYKRLPEHKF